MLAVFPLYDAHRAARDLNALRARPEDASTWDCLICDRPLVDPENRTMWVHLHHGGSQLVTTEEATALEGDAEAMRGDMGLFPVGPECRRRHPELRPYLVWLEGADGAPSDKKGRSGRLSLRTEHLLRGLKQRFQYGLDPLPPLPKREEYPKTLPSKQVHAFIAEITRPTREQQILPVLQELSAQKSWTKRQQKLLARLTRAAQLERVSYGSIGPEVSIGEDVPDFVHRMTQSHYTTWVEPMLEKLLGEKPFGYAGAP